MAITKEEINAANAEVLRVILSAKPTLVSMGIAGETIPNMTPTMILHSGPPIDWVHMTGVQRGGVIGALIYEGMAKDDKEAEELAASGKIIFEPCNHHSAVGPMAGILSYHMPVFIVENKTYGNKAYCTFNEGIGKVLRFGAYQSEVIEKLKWLEKELYPIVKEALSITGEIDLELMISEALKMGDEGHNRNKAGTSLLFRKLAPAILQTHFTEEEKVKALKFIDSNDQFFLNLSMSVAKCIMDFTFCDVNPKTNGATIVSTMACNGYEFGIRISGLGQNKWFIGPSEIVTGLYLPGFTEVDANKDIGDSCIIETMGIGGFCMGTAPSIVQFIGGTIEDILNYSRQMYEITEGEGTTYKIPAFNFRGSATGIDIRKVIKTQILPIICTDIVSNKSSIGQIGAGIVHPPMKCFEDALMEYKKVYLL